MSATKIRSGVTTIEKAQSWQYQTMLIPHEPFRMFDEWIIEYVVNNPTFDPIKYPWKARNFATWWNKYYYKNLHHHHDIEEEIVVPYFKKIGMPVLDETLDDHVPLLKGMDDITSHLAQLAAISHDSDKVKEWTGSLKRQLAAHVEQMNKHLDEEEASWCPLIEQHMSRAQYKVLEKKIVSSNSVEASRTFLPAIVEAMRDWGGPSVVDGFLGAIPAYLPPVRGWVTGSWNNKYQAVQKQYLLTLKEERDPLIVESVGCCGASTPKAPPQAVAAAEKLAGPAGNLKLPVPASELARVPSSGDPATTQAGTGAVQQFPAA